MGRTLGDLVALEMPLVDIKVRDGKGCGCVVGKLPSADVLDSHLVPALGAPM
jgi:hypothetical protein